MLSYIYKIYFKTDSQNYRYVMEFTIEADNNDQAKAEGVKRWKEQTEKRERLKVAKVIKTTCRKKETAPRKKKPSPLQKALAELNSYLIDELDK